MTSLEAAKQEIDNLKLGRTTYIKPNLPFALFDQYLQVLKGYRM